MEYSFTCYGHENITAQHKNTLEFTKDSFVTEKGDCIVGCNADFSFNDLKEFVENTCKEKKECKVKVTVVVDDTQEEIVGILNPHFSDEREIVIRKSDFISERTLLIFSDKGAIDLHQKLKEKLVSKNKILVTIVGL